MFPSVPSARLKSHILNVDDRTTLCQDAGVASGSPWRLKVAAFGWGRQLAIAVVAQLGEFHYSRLSIDSDDADATENSAHRSGENDRFKMMPGEVVEDGGGEMKFAAGS
jgi:hypothetical protein